MSGALYKLVKEGGVGTFSRVSVFYHKGVPMYVYSIVVLMYNSTSTSLCRWLMVVVQFDYMQLLVTSC